MHRSIEYSPPRISEILTGESKPMQRACPVCGATHRPIEGAHTVPRSIQKKPEAPIIPLCKRCHEAHDAYQMTFKPHRDGWYALIADDQLAKRLSGEGVRNVRADQWFPLLFDDGFGNYPQPSEEVPDIGDTLHTLAETIRTAAERGAEAWRLRAEAVIASERLFEAAFDKRAARAESREWRRNLGVSDSEASGMRRVVNTLEEHEARTLPRTMQELLARAIHDGKEEREQLMGDAHVLSVSSFRDAYYPRDESEWTACPTCGAKMKEESHA